VKQPGPKLRALIFLSFAACIWLLPILLDPLAVPFQPGADFTDLLVSHWPNAQYLRSSLHEWGQFPLWNSQILCGAPLVADPLFAIWYPPTWLTLILPISFAQNLSFWLHLILAGVGMFFLMRSEGASDKAAFAGGLLFGGSPKLVGHVALGHISLVSAVAWTPWVMLTLRRAIVGLNLPWQNAVKRAALAGLMIGISFLADPRWLAPLFLLGGSYAFKEFIFKRREHGAGILRKALILGMFCTIIALLIAAGQAIPLTQFALRSTRAHLLQDGGSFGALPADRLLGLLFPAYGGWGEWQVYFGFIGMALVLFGLLSKESGRLYWLGVALAGYALALGDATPLYGFLTATFPFMGWIRVPARFIFVSYLAMSVLAARGLHALEAVRGGESRKLLRIAIVGLAVFTSGIAIGALILIRPEAISSQLTWWIPMLLAWLMMGLVLMRKRESQKNISRAAVLLALIIIEIGIMDFSLLSMHEKPFTNPSTDLILEALDTEQDVGRVFSLAYNIPQHIAAQMRLELADGVNPLQLQSTWDFMSQAVGFNRTQYSVTLPPFPDGLLQGADGSKLDPVLLGRLNITHIVAATPLQADGLKLIGVWDNTYLYRNEFARPRAWVEVSDGIRESAAIRLWSPNRIQIEVRGPGRLVLSEIDYPGWVVTLNGDSGVIEAHNGLLRSIELPDGSSMVEFHYQPWDVYIGAILTFMTVLILFVLWRRL